MKNPFKLIASFLFGLTPAGKRHQMNSRALNNLKEKKAISHLEKKELQGQINSFVNRMKRSNTIKSGHHMQVLVIKKFAEKIGAANLRLNVFNFELQDA